MGKLDGKVCIVTGGASGMGESHVRTMVAEGAIVYCTDLNEKAGKKLAKELGKNCYFVKQDVTSEEDWKSLVRTIRKQHGRIDVLVNNAGILVRVTPITDLPLSEYQKGVNVDQVSVFLGMKYVLPVMKEQKSGSIINIASTNSTGGSRGESAYVSAKYAVRGLTKAAVMEVGQYGIRVNSILPGLIDTPMSIYSNPVVKLIHRAYMPIIPLRRSGKPGDVSNLVVFLASDDSEYLSGTEIVVDGGLTSTNLSYTMWVQDISGRKMWDLGMGYTSPKNPILKKFVDKFIKQV